MAKKGKKGGGRGLLIAGAAVVLVAIGFAAASLMQATKEKLRNSPYAAPADPVVSANVQTSLASLRGKVVLLDFWATWCGPCRSEISGFVSLQDKYRNQGLEIVGVSLDPITPAVRAEYVAPFMKSMKINYTVWMVNNMAATSGFDYSQGIPTTYLIDRTGRIVNRYVGARPESAFENDVKRLL
jgi:thiol-disulfide isomerase/thioredoxin